MHKCCHEGLFGWQQDTAGASACNDNLMQAFALPMVATLEKLLIGP